MKQINCKITILVQLGPKGTIFRASEWISTIDNCRLSSSVVVICSICCAFHFHLKCNCFNATRKYSALCCAQYCHLRNGEHVFCFSFIFAHSVRDPCFYFRLTELSIDLHKIDVLNRQRNGNAKKKQLQIQTIDATTTATTVSTAVHNECNEIINRFYSVERQKKEIRAGICAAGQKIRWEKYLNTILCKFEHYRCDEINIALCHLYQCAICGTISQ